MSDCLKQMLELLTGAYNRGDIQNTDKKRPVQTNIGRLFSLAAGNFEILREHAGKVLLWDNIDNARGAVLDRYGLNFGVARQGTNDDFYRLLIKVKIIAMLSGGDIDTVINAAASLFSVQPENIELGELFPAKIRIYVDERYLDGYRIETAALIMKVMKRIIAAGVGIELTFMARDEYTAGEYSAGVTAELIEEAYTE